MNIIKKQIQYNISPRTIPIKFIVIHYTANYSSGAGPEMHYRYFNSGKVGASADFFVDDKTILQINDYLKFYTWAIGDNTYYGERCGKVNINSVHIEICVNPESNLEIAKQNTLKLTAFLMKELSIPLENVVRHLDCSGKKCPVFWVDDYKWKTEFKDKLIGEMIWLYNKDLTPEEIVRRASTSGDAWVKALDSIKLAAEANGSLGDVEMLKFIYALVKKIYDLDR